MGRRYELEDFIDLCLGLQRAGCHNVNLVTPEPWIPHVVEGIRRARGRGLRVPVVYNTSGFIAEASLAMLEGTVDVYLTDVRYASPQQAQEFSGAASYFEACRRAAVTMWRQVGPLVCDSRGIARTGLIVRHLVLPGLPEATASSLDFIAGISRDCAVSLLGQYLPLHKAVGHPVVGRPISIREYAEALRLLRERGLTKGWQQRPGPATAEFVGSLMSPTEPGAWDGSRGCARRVRSR